MEASVDEDLPEIRDGEEQLDGDDSMATDKSIDKPEKKLARSERKRKYYENLLVKRKESRKIRKEAKHQRMRDRGYKGGEKHGQKTGRREKEEMRNRCREAMETGQKICIDCGLERFMSKKEKGKLAMQFGRLYGSNKKAQHPAHIYITGLKHEGELHEQMVKKNEGFTRYMIDCHEISYTDLFSTDQIVYLTPDSDNLLDDIDPEKVYIIGGLVDEGVKKNVSRDAADQLSIATARLPIEEHMDRREQASYSKVLAVNQVFDILMTYMETKCWKKALQAGVPPRKGFVIKESHEDS